MSFDHEKKMAGLVKSRYDILEDLALKDNSVLDEKNREFYADQVGNKIVELMFIEYEEKGFDGEEYKKLRKEISKSLDDLVEIIKKELL